MKIFGRFLQRVFPRDPINRVGYYWFSLPRTHWMTRAGDLHDWDYDNAKDSGRKRSEADSDLFWRWTMEAHAEEDPIKRCHMMQDICLYWPLARRVGRLLWDN